MLVGVVVSWNWKGVRVEESGFRIHNDAQHRSASLRFVVNVVDGDVRCGANAIERQRQT